MSKTYYSDYVRHALRFYSRNCATKPFFKTKVDRENWVSCDKVISTYTDEEIAMIKDIYRGYDTFPDEVYNASK